MSEHPSGNQTAISELLRQAETLHHAGDLAAAQRSYLAILDLAPEHALALHHLGLIAAQEGDYGDALQLFERAIAAGPKRAPFYTDLAKTLHALGRLDEAVTALHLAIELRPGSFDAYLNLGHVLRRQGQLPEAADCYRTAAHLAPRTPAGHLALGHVESQQGHHAAASAAYRTAIELDAGLHDAYIGLANSLQQQGELTAALACLQQATTQHPDSPELLLNLANMLTGLGSLDQAIAAYRETIALAPQLVDAYMNLGHALKMAGQIDASLNAYHTVLTLRPDYTEVYRSISIAKRFVERADPDLANMETLWRRADLDVVQRMHLAFALGKAYEDLAVYDQAFDFFSAGNNLKRARTNYDVARDEAFMARLRQVFTAARLAEGGDAGMTDARPIFVVGMPRSGTTLTEQILAAHPAVFGAGELGVLPILMRGIGLSATRIDSDFDLGTLQTSEILRLAGEYLRLAAQFNTTHRPFLTDKMPANFLYLGMIRLMFPAARVIHCRRDPIDTCLSCFKHFFSGHIPYSYDLRELGRFYRAYEQLMAHWHAVLPGFVYDVQYEALVCDQERESRRLLEFCGLPWDESCLDFHRSQRAVKTTSVAQVRQPVYRDAVQRWRHYESHLGPLIDALRA